MIVITELLGTDSVSASRFTINANFNSIKNEVDSIESVFGLSLTAGNIDITGNSGGQILANFGGFNNISLPSAGAPVITLNGTTGGVVCNSINVGAVQAATVNISNGLDNQGSSNFAQAATFGGVVTLNNGLRYNRVDVGATVSHTVLNSDRVIIFDGSGGTLEVLPDVSLLDGHVITLVKREAGACALDTTNIAGFLSGSITFSTDSYKSSITLMWNSAISSFVVIGSSNVAFV
jgi:hypothetical protein